MDSFNKQIDDLEFPSAFKDSDYKEFFSKVKNIILVDKSLEEEKLIHHDFEKFNKDGLWRISKIFAGGIIFLREPETIEKAKIEFFSNNVKVISSAIYASEIRNTRNVKYKPNAGKIESLTWNLAGVFPNFEKYIKELKITLMIIIGKTIKSNCEYLQKTSWFMRYEKSFKLELLLDNKLEKEYLVEAN